MALFLSTYVNKIDKKGRVSVPALYRAALIGNTGGKNSDFNGLVVFRSYKYTTLEACSVDRMQRLSDSIDTLDLFSDAQDSLSATIFADAQPVVIDGEGRMMLPADLLEFAGITDQVCFVGRGATFQIWEPVRFQKHQIEAREKTKAAGLTLKLNPHTGGGA